jgi:hypothetical protein
MKVQQTTGMAIELDVGELTACDLDQVTGGQTVREFWWDFATTALTLMILCENCDPRLRSAK